MKASQIVKRFDALKSQRSNLDTVLQKIETYVLPFRGEFFSQMSSEHEVDWERKEIYDNTACIAVNLLASQIHGNLTSPVNKWFGLRYRDEDLNTDVAAKEWLEDAEDKVWQTLQESNFDTAAPEAYLDSSGFGTSIITMEDVDDIQWKGVQFNALQLMDAYFEAGPDGMPYRIYRRLRYTKLELEDAFQLPDDLKPKDKNDTDPDEKIDVIFCIYKEPKNNSDEPILAPTLRPVQWRYVHKNSGRFLKLKGMNTVKGGYYDFPGMTLRWQKTAGAKWGYSPAMIMISDIITLNDLVAMKTEATAKELDPPMKTTEQGVVGDLDNVPGGLTLVTQMDALDPLYPHSNFSAGVMEEGRLQESIRAGFFVDKLEMKDSPAMTATEAQIRYERMLRMLAPTMGRMKADFLMPVVTGIFNKLLRYGQLNEMPDSVQGAELDVEFTGALPRAIKGEIADGMERWLIGISGQVELNPEVLDIVDFDQYNRTMAELRGVPAKVTRTDDEVQETRDRRAEEQKAMRDIEMARAAGDAGKSLGEGAKAMEEGNVDLGLEG